MNSFDFSKIRGAALAPMAGVADSAFRSLCRCMGAVFTVSEMISCKGLHYQDKKSRQLMNLLPGERPAGIQLFGDDPVLMAEAAKMAMEYKPEFVDINMGCPVPKVAGNGCGAALMKDVRLAATITRAVVDAIPLPVSVKFRKGWDNDSVNAVEFAKALEASGAAALTVHGRTRAQMYAPPVDLDIIAAVKNAVRIPVIGNGGIYTAQDALDMLKHTGCDIVMVAQGALGNPFIFEQINALLTDNVLLPPPSVERRLAVMMQQARASCELKGELRGILEGRKHAAWYLKGLHGAAGFKRRAVAVSSLAELESLAEDVLAANQINE